MANRLAVYKCSLCGNMVSMLHVGGGTLVCCGEEMNLLTENTTDAAKEKHVPSIEKTDSGYKVKVGEVSHPMEEKHYIEWIELITGDQTYLAFLKPGQAPEATFTVQADRVTARAYCNLHGLWKAEK